MRGVPILDVEEIKPLTEYLGLVVSLDTQALFCVQPTKPLFQFAYNRFIH